MTRSTTSPRLRVGIVGCGRIAGNHANAFRAVPGVEVVGCADPQPGRAADFAREHGLPVAVETAEALIAQGLDALTVCTPHPVHEQVVLEAAAAGLHVLCEKPVAVDLAAADRMIAATERAGVRFGVLFQRRFWPAAQRIRAAIDDGRLGRPVLGEVTVLLHRPTDYYAADAWRGSWETDGGGVLMTQAIHQIDMLQWFLGRPTQVSGFIRTHIHGDHIETEDTASAVVAFESGATATITATTGTNHNLGNRVTVVGETGAVASILEFPEGHEGANDIWTVPGETGFTMPYEASAPSRPLIGEVNTALADFHTLQVQDFADAIIEDRDPAVTGRDARASLAITTGVYESARTGTVVDLTTAPIGATA
ncbi:MAG: Gfo/Idh/MocA family protein [Nocardioides sp.]|uniref:Gfo/Idh/MocA family protein n=1 Tax=Nocardioides sp. TaxID=35761 RepID=UPI003D6C3117